MTLTKGQTIKVNDFTTKVDAIDQDRVYFRNENDEYVWCLAVEIEG